MKLLMMAAGWLCVVLGVIGIFLPLLPTTPFLLLAAWLFARSSERFHTWLISHPKLGPIIHAWQSGEGLDRKVRRRILIVLWLSMFLSMAIVAKLWSTLMLTTIATCVTIYILRQPVVDSSVTENNVVDDKSGEAPAKELIE